MGRHSIPRPGDRTPDEPPFRPPSRSPSERAHEPYESQGASGEAHEEPEQPYERYGQQYEDEAYEPADHDYPEEPEATTPPPTPPPPTGGTRGGGHYDGGGWRGGHRRGDGGRRGVSIGVIVALVAVVVVVAGVILWRFFGDALSNRSHTAANRCVGGNQAVAVVVDPAIADQIRNFADRYNKTASPVGDRCIAIGVKAADSDNVINGFTGNWPKELGDKPALWIPGSTVSTARLQAAAGPQTISDARSLVASPILLAIKPQLKPALSNQNWGTLPGLQTNPVSLEQLNMPGWGSLRLALPVAGASDASFLAAEAVAASAAPSGAPASAGAGAVSTLMSAQPKLPNNSTSAAMDALLTGGDPATAPVHAVVTTEQQLYRRSAKLSEPKSAVSSWLPPGPVVQADYPTALLSGNWLSEEQVTAASEFARFLRKPEQLNDLAKAGFRSGSGTLPKSDVTSFAPLAEPLSIKDDSVRINLANIVTTPATGPAVTIMLDQSMPTPEGSNSRLGNVINALDNRLGALPPNSVVGLWTFDGKEGRSEVSTGPLSDPVSGQPRSAALRAALDRQYSSGGGAVSFTTLRLIYDAMLANYRPGMKNSVLVITAGLHTDKTLDGPGLQDYIRKTFDPSRPVAVNVIDFGSNTDRPTWESVAQLSGGTYRNFSTSDTPDLATAITTFLS